MVWLWSPFAWVEVGYFGHFDVLVAILCVAAVAWFLQFLVRHSMYWFVAYRVVVGAVVLALLGTGVVAAT